MSIHVIGESDIDNFLLLQRIRDFLLLMRYINLRLLTFSTTFDRKLRLEMGRYEATSLGSKFGFFRRGR